MNNTPANMTLQEAKIQVALGTLKVRKDIFIGQKFFKPSSPSLLEGFKNFSMKPVHFNVTLYHLKGAFLSKTMGCIANLIIDDYKILRNGTYTWAIPESFNCISPNSILTASYKIVVQGDIKDEPGLILSYASDHIDRIKVLEVVDHYL